MLCQLKCFGSVGEIVSDNVVIIEVCAASVGEMVAGL